MKYRRLDKNGDYVFGSGNNNFLEGSEAVAQAVSTRLKLLQGEWWEDLEDGLPLWQEILGSQGSNQHLTYVDNLITQRIFNTQGVTQIIDYQGTWDSAKRQYSFNAKINTSYSETTIEGIL